MRVQNDTKTFKQIVSKKGDEVGVSRWFEITQSLIDAYADITEDHQFIHLDTKRTKEETPFDGTVAHGFLTVSLLSAMAYDALPDFENVRMGVNYGFNRLRFLAPVPSGSRIRGRFVLKDIEEQRPSEITMTWTVTVEIEDSDKPALIAEWINRYYLEGD